MEQESIVYGCIKDVASGPGDALRRDANRKAMLSLPKSEEWPFLCQEMFAIPQMDVHAEAYLTDVVHFGASYRAIEYEWSSWIEKFEHLLNQMYWVSAVVHLETELYGTHTFTWESRNDGHTPGAGIKQVHCEWTQESTFTR